MIVQMPGVPMTVESLLHQLLERGDLKAVVVVAKHADDTFESFWTCQTVSDLALAAITLQADVADTARNRGDATVIAPRKA